MKNLIVSTVLIGNFVMAGGDIVPVEPTVETSTALSEGNFYAGVGVSAVSTRDSAVSMNIFNVKNGQDRLGNAVLQIGYDINSYIAIEGRYTTTFVKEDIVTMDGWSLFLKPQYPLTEEMSLYALLGYGGVNIDGTNLGTLVDVNDNGFQWGVGTEYKIDKTIEVFFDYTSLAKDMDGRYGAALQADADAFTLGITYNF